MAHAFKFFTSRFAVGLEKRGALVPNVFLSFALVPVANLGSSRSHLHMGGTLVVKYLLPNVGACAPSCEHERLAFEPPNR